MHGRDAEYIVLTRQSQARAILRGTAGERGLLNVNIQFNLVKNSRLATDARWAQEYGYHATFTKDALGGKSTTWEKWLD